MPSPLKITALTRKDGCSYHRVQMPLERLQSDDTLVIFSAVEALQEVHFQFADVFYYNQFFDMPEHAILEHKKRFNIRFVVDMDDYWVFNSSHPNYTRFNATRMPQYLVALRIADIVFTTHERLAERIYPYNKNVHVLPNSLPYGYGQFDIDRADTAVFHGPKEIGVIYPTSGSNLPNAKVFEPAARLLATKEHPAEIVFQICGPTPIVSAITGQYKLKYNVLPWLPAEQYMEHYRYGDIVIAPMQSNTFTAMKSNLKVLEAAAKKLPIVASYCHPYLGFPENSGILYARSPKEWVDIILHLSGSPEAREMYGNKIHEYCKQHFHLDDVNKKRLELIKSVL